MGQKKQFGKRQKQSIILCGLQNDIGEAQHRFQKGNFMQSFDIYEQMLSAYPESAILILAEVYERYQSLPSKDRYSLYQSRHFDFGINPSDKVLDIGSGHIPFPFATHLADITLEDHRYGRAGVPFMHVQGNPVYECNVEAMPFQDKEFDFVYCSHVLEHVQDPHKACRELMRVGKKGYIESPAKGKDIFLNSLKVSQHRWWLELINESLVFTEYQPEEIDAFQCNILQDMHSSPRTEREKAFSALIYLKADMVNTMLLWEKHFNYEVRPLAEKKQVYSIPDTTTLQENPTGDDVKEDLIADDGDIIKALDILLSQQPKDPNSLLSMTAKLIENGHLDEAEELCNYLVSEYGDSLAVFKILGFIFYITTDFENALKYFEKVFNLDKTDISTGQSIAETLCKLGRMQDATITYERLLTLFPDSNDEIRNSMTQAGIKAETILAQPLKHPGNKKLRFMQVHTFYPDYLNRFYNTNPSLTNAPFSVQIKSLIADGFSGIHIFAPYMSGLGYEANLVVANNPHAQMQWLKEKGMVLASSNDWIFEILVKQIEAFAPDVLYLSDPITFDSRFIRKLSKRPRLIIGWKAANIPENTDWSEFDIMMSSLSSLRAVALKLGAKSAEHFFPGYPAGINNVITDVKPKFDVVFSGQWTLQQHPRRNEHLTHIARESSRTGFSCAFYLSGQTDTIPQEIAQYDHGQKFGVDMYRALRSGRIAFDARGILEIADSTSGRMTDLAGRETANMRIFEVTGSGVFLLTEHHENLNQYFQPGVEIETFVDEKELIEKIRYYLAHPDEREAIAKSGQERCLCDYSMEKRAVAFDTIIRKYLDLKNDQISGSDGSVSVSILRDKATKFLETNDHQSAFTILIQAKSLKQPLAGLDLLRAKCFIHQNKFDDAREALREELRLFSTNKEAIELLGYLQQKVSCEPCTEGSDTEFDQLLNEIRPYTMLPRARLYSLFTLAKHICAKNIPGNFVECGVAAGGSSALLAYVIKKHSIIPRMLYSFDSFSGMPAPTNLDKHRDIPADETGWGTGTCSATEESVRDICQKLGVLDIVKPIQGYFKDTLPIMRNEINHIALLHMDGDWYESTRDILINIYVNVDSEGIIQVDDYGYWEGCRKAIHEYEEVNKIHFDMRNIDGTGVWFFKPPKKTPKINQNKDVKLLNLGCGSHYREGWINVDFHSTGTGVIAHNLNSGIPFENSSVDVLYHSHLLEHFPKNYAPIFMKECHRVLKPGGIIRVVVPDLERIARLYLDLLEQASRGDEEAKKKYAWITLELFDQMVRNYSGGEMKKYWKQNPMPAESFVIERVGGEVTDVLNKLRSCKNTKPQPVSLEIITDSIVIDPRKLGEFRLSGEIHQWMYDRYSLGKLLRKAGLGDAIVCQADESSIPDFKAYLLDVEADGSVRKPDSLFMEAFKA